MTHKQAQYLRIVKRDLAESNTSVKVKAVATRSVLDYWRKMGLKGEDLMEHTAMLRLHIFTSSFGKNHTLASFYIRRLEALWEGDVIGSLLENADVAKAI
ncbi:MAG: hypothetical protein AAFX95_26010 [Cyanobacteria bacterium J06639_16]